MLKITMNLPAEKQFFPEDQGIVGVILDFDIPNGLRIRPTSRATKGLDFFPLTTRARGGLEISIISEREQEIAECLRNVGKNDFFFLNSSSNSDWLSLQPYEGEDRYPPRTKPHLRAWNLFKGTQAPSDKNRHELVVSEIRKAANLVAGLHGDEIDECVELQAAQSLLSEITEIVAIGNNKVIINSLRRSVRFVIDQNENATARSEEIAAARELIDEIRKIIGLTINEVLVQRARDLLSLALDPAAHNSTLTLTPNARDEVSPDFPTQMGSDRSKHERRIPKIHDRSRDKPSGRAKA